ncbi:hypothetical protein [Phenylobacterium hankyongense]|nr:hypothetical protein [Phenylobacterium hankyongense]
MIRLVAALTGALCLSACASAYVGKPYDRASAGVHSIAVVADSVPDKASAYEVASVGSNFGLIGALVDAGIQSSRTNAVNEALAGSGFEAESRVEQRLVSRLTAEGYTVQKLANGPHNAKREFLVTYPGAAGADAYLDLTVVNFGYLSAGAGQPFRPTVFANVRLVSARDTKKVLMENRIVYNAMGAAQGVITLTPDPQYAFKNRAALLEDPKRLAAGIEGALNQVADTVAQLLS